MKRLEYMTILRQKLVDGGLGNDEINDALEFYEELFLDGGYENEEKTAQNLGDPEMLAKQILAENGAVGFVRPQPTMDDYVDNRGAQQTQTTQPGYNIAPDNRRTALLIIVLVTSIVWAPTLIGLLSGAFAVAVGLAAAIFSIGCVGVGLLVTGGVTAFQAPPVGVLMIGIGPLSDLHHSAVVGLAAFQLALGNEDIMDKEIVGSDEIGQLPVYLEPAYKLVFCPVKNLDDLCLFDVLLPACHEAYFHAVAVEGSHRVALRNEDGLVATVGHERVLTVGLAHEGSFLHLSLCVELESVFSSL